MSASWLVRRRVRARLRGRSVTLYTSPRCTLCAQAAALLASMKVAFREIDATEDADRFLRIPVLEVDGRVVAEGPISPRSLVRGIAGA